MGIGKASSEELGSETIGARVRLLRKAAGLSQAQLAGGRFSKEYLSQVELGKTRPTRVTLEWLARRLATDREFLEEGISRAESERIENSLRDAELLLDQHRYEDAFLAFRDLGELIAGVGVPALALRRLRGEAWALIRMGELDSATSLLEEAAAVAVRAGFSDLDRAEVVFQVGVCRYSQSRISEAVVLLEQALVLAERSGLPCDRLRSDIFHWRSRCHRRNRDWVAAHEDIERALELAEACSDSRRSADALFQASLVAQREGRWVLARSYAERSRALFEELGDEATVARLLNNLAGLSHLLGDPARAISLLREAFEIFVELGLAVDAGYICSSLADVHLDCGEFEQAEAQARKALELLADRVDHLQEVGTAQLALGRAVAAQGRLGEADELIASADRTFEQASSLAHRSDAWIAQGDLAGRRGDHREAGNLYRRAALALLDSR
jgi:tetratricopeptide (TPR) repeat protein